MRLFARLEVSLDGVEDADQPTVERLISDDVDLALWLRQQVEGLDHEHGAAWEAELHLEPLTNGDEA